MFSRRASSSAVLSNAVAIPLRRYSSSTHTIDEPFLLIGEIEDKRDTPAFSLSRLLELLPETIDDEYGKRLYTFKIKYVHTFPDAPWMIKYEADEISHGTVKNPVFFAKSPIESCVKVIEWVMSNGYELNGI